MRSQKASPAGQPIRTHQKVFVWVGIVLILLFTALGGGGLIHDGVSSRRVLADGPVGTFAPADRKCTKDGCVWIGTFSATDGTVTEKGVELRDAVKVRRGDSMPAAINDVRLDDEATDPTAYTADFNSSGQVVKGSVLLLAGLGLAGGLVAMLRWYRAAARSS